jgi:hypothetical protein
MGRPKKSAPKHVEPEDISQEEPEEEPEVEEEPESTGKSMSKADVCRALLAEGITENEDAIAAAGSRFGVEIKATDFTLYKSKQKQAAVAAPAKRGRKPKVAESVARKPQVEGYVAPPEKPKAPGEPDMLLALEGIKELVGQFGADRVKRMVDIIG